MTKLDTNININLKETTRFRNIFCCFHPKIHFQSTQNQSLSKKLKTNTHKSNIKEKILFKKKTKKQSITELHISIYNYKSTTTPTNYGII